ncbi:MAG: VCBS repeat-containing protein, partial [Gammaproteobacteria bacterium]|nr:VCBS repeat-containing protein [Gammaproteobacteria bacterium]
MLPGTAKAADTNGPANAVEAIKGPRITTTSPRKGTDTTERLRHEEWGQTNYGEGYVYGPTNRRSGMTMADIDLDGDNDFIFPGIITTPQLMRNLGSNDAFFPGGSTTIKATGMPQFTRWDLNMDFGDLNGDGLPDLVAVANFENGFDTFTKRVLLFTNDGPRTDPSYSFDRILYSSNQAAGNQQAMWVALA